MFSIIKLRNLIPGRIPPEKSHPSKSLTSYLTITWFELRHSVKENWGKNNGVMLKLSLFCMSQTAQAAAQFP